MAFWQFICALVLIFIDRLPHTLISHTWYCRKWPSLANTEHFIPSAECAPLLRTHANCELGVWQICTSVQLPQRKYYSTWQDGSTSVLHTNFTCLNNQSGGQQQSMFCYAPVIGLQLNCCNESVVSAVFGFQHALCKCSHRKHHRQMNCSVFKAPGFISQTLGHQFWHAFSVFLNFPEKWWHDK
jgi:hypothetical protein